MLPPTKNNNSGFFLRPAGFSLIELLIAMAIFTGISSVGVKLLWDTLTTRDKQYSIENISDNFRIVISTLTKSIQGAKSVNVLDPWTIQITSASPEPCRTIILDNNQKIIQALDASDPCTPPAVGSAGFNSILKDEILIKNKTTGTPFFSPTGNFLKAITIEIKGTYKSGLGEQDFNFKTTVSSRISI